jgi:hypothetical protein
MATPKKVHATYHTNCFGRYLRVWRDLQGRFSIAPRVKRDRFGHFAKQR